MQIKISPFSSPCSENEFAQLKQSFGHSYILIYSFLFTLYIDYISNICYIQVKDKWLSSHRQAYGFSPRIYNSFDDLIYMVKDLRETISVNNNDYHIIRLLGKGKGGYSYLVNKDSQKYVLKQIHHEPCDCYSFGNKIEAEYNDYNRLINTNLSVPRMIDIDFGNERILKEYIEGPDIATLVKKKLMKENYYSQIEEMAQMLKEQNLNIDYYPTNFIVQNDKLYYIDYECNTYMEEYSYQVWGKQYWY